MNKILLLDGQTIQALPAAKSFKKAGFYVVLFCDSNNSYGYHTRYADEKVIVPSSKDDPNGLHEKVVRYLSSNQVVAIVPMNDYSAMYLSKNKHTMEQLTKVMIPEYDVFIKGFDKNKLMGICLDNSFPHPKTVDLTTCSPTEAVAQLQLPALIKPNETTGARGFALINSADELESKLESIQKEYGDCHLQEFIPAGGNQYKVELFIWEEKLVNATVLHKFVSSRKRREQLFQPIG
jgi:carbamoylphosphate synthase large subunit